MLVGAGWLLEEVGALSEGFVLANGLVLAEDTLWGDLVEAEGVTLGAFVVSDRSVDVVATGEL